jgi:hypothetical protein
LRPRHFPSCGRKILPEQIFPPKHQWRCGK